MNEEEAKVDSTHPFFGPWESVASSWEDFSRLLDTVEAISTKRRTLVWRGMSNSTYALHSSLYRRLLKTKGTPPTELQLVNAEMKILDAARNKWRFGNLSALEILANIQHYGGQTRFIDVTFNPLIALWFAVEAQSEHFGQSKPETDGRILAFDATARFLNFDDFWGGHDLPWADFQPVDWGMQLPTVWRPPSYNDRIAAQNSAFLVGGVPSVRSGTNAKYRKGPGDGQSTGTWRIQDVRAATSVSLSMNTTTRVVQERATPTFTIRISASAKREIRTVLATRFGISHASMYPDLQGLARFGFSESEKFSL